MEAPKVNTVYTNDYLKQNHSDRNYTAGDHTYGKPRIRFRVPDVSVIIGNYCSIANDCDIICAGEHYTKTPSTYPFGAFKSEFPSTKMKPTLSNGDIVIGNDVWIGALAIILSGSTIGSGSIIGAGAVVRGNIPPYSIVIGNPGVIVKQRHTPEQIEQLLDIAWWDWDQKTIEENIDIFELEDIQEFIKKAKSINSDG